eukprot:Amastigsp_a340184_45.p1 type:complete len:274 gc:universal Amastigsp_a340184_45:880-59(-)
MASETSSFVVSLLSGAAAGAAVDLSLFPIDTLKTRLQSREGFWKAGGFKSIYSGISSAMIGSMPSAALFFTVYDGCKTALLQVPWLAASPALAHMTAAAAGEVSACLVRVPTEVTKQRLQTGQHRSLAESVRAILSKEGLGGLYRGFGVTIARELPFAFIQFPLYERFKVLLAARAHDGRISSYQAAACGSLAGGIAAALTTPLDVLKTRVMLSREVPRPSMAHVLRQILRDEGPATLLNGIQPRVLWISIGGFVFFGVYEQARALLARASTD